MKWNGKTALALCLGLAAVAAHAEVGTMFTMPNDAGGLMNFTDGTSKKCEERSATSKFEWQYVDSVAGSGRVAQKGCWRYDASTKNVVVMWSDGDEYRFPLSNLEVTEYWTGRYGSDKPVRPTKRNGSL